MEPSSAQTSPRASLPDNTASIGELSAHFASQQRAKSPPLAFEPTPNDALVAPANTGSNITSPQPRIDSMGRSDLPFGRGEPYDSQAIIDQQTLVINKLHDTFAAERKVWDLERERLYNRITSLESLLRAGDSYSPAKSPVLSPFNGGNNVASPQARAASASHRLPSIAEDENIQSLSSRREVAPQAIEIPAITNYSFDRRTSVNFAEATPGSVKVEEIPVSPAPTGRALSPPPFSYRAEAGHTPLARPRPSTPPPQNVTSMDGIDDTPTRNNTHINAFLTRSNDEESEKELKGPLNMPELPHVPDESNFTFDMLSKRLEQIEKHPEDSKAKPMVFMQPSPGLASPADGDYEASPRTVDP